MYYNRSSKIEYLRNRTGYVYDNFDDFKGFRKEIRDGKAGKFQDEKKQKGLFKLLQKQRNLFRGKNTY